MESFIGWRRQKQGYISRNLSEPLVWFTVTVIQVCSCEELKGWLPVSYLYDTQMWQERTLAIAWRPNPGWAYKKSYWTLLQHGAQQSLDIFSFEDYVSAIRLPWLPPPYPFILLQLPSCLDFKSPSPWVFSGSWQPLIMHLSATELLGISAQDTVQQKSGSSYISVKKYILSPFCGKLA